MGNLSFDCCRLGFSEEPFLKHLYWLSFGKVRVSWGKSGQKFGQRYLAHGLMTSSGSFLGTSGIVPDTDGGVINRKLTWGGNESI